MDTADRRLDRAGYSVRLRRSRRGPAEATLKSLNGGRPDALRIRRELAEELEVDNPAAVAGAQGAVGTRVRALVGARKLVPLFDLQTRRRAFPLAIGEIPSGELLLDETVIREPGGALLSRLRRVEVEVPEPALATVGPFVESLQHACGLQPAVLSKYESALVASGSGRTEPETFGRTSVEPDDTVGQLGLAVLRRQFASLLANEPGARLGDDIEDLHAMRVASRRLRAAISLFGDVLPIEATRLSPELAWIGRMIGGVRDLDVQIVQLDDWAAILPSHDGEPLARLRALLTTDRNDARAELLQALDSPRYDRLVRRCAAMLRTRSGARTTSARAAAPALIERRHSAVRKAHRRIGRGDDPDAYHRLRIAGKRFRYALEFFADVYPGETTRVVRRTVELQDLLGAYQDANVAIVRLRDVAAARGAELGPEAVFAMGEVAERYRAEMDARRRHVPAAFAKVDGKAWKRLRRQLRAARPTAASP